MGAWNELYFSIFQYNWFSLFSLLFGPCKHIVLQRDSLCKNVKNPQEEDPKSASQPGDLVLMMWEGERSGEGVVTEQGGCSAAAATEWP